MPVNPNDQQEFSDADWRAVATGDQSKKLKLLLSGISTGTTRVWTAPDADITFSAFAATFLDDASAAAVLATLGAVNIAGDTMTGLLTVPGIAAGRASVADDAVANLGSLSPSVVSLLFVWREGSSSGAALATCFSIRTSASPVCTLNFGFSTLIDTVTTNVTGTTGVDTHTTISATSGALKIENRSGGTLAFGYALLRAA